MSILDFVQKVYAGTSFSTSNTISSINDLITIILQAVIRVGMPVVAVAIVYAGFLFVSAGGNEAKLTQAKTVFFWTVIGAAIVLGAIVIRDVVATTVRDLSG